MLRRFGVLSFGVFMFYLAAARLSAQGNSQNVDLPDKAAILVPGSSVEIPEIGRAHV
jgi:hypothetical protein